MTTVITLVVAAVSVAVAVVDLLLQPFEPVSVKTSYANV